MNSHPIGLLVENVCQLNNGAMQQLGEFLRDQPPTVRAQFIGRCAAMIESASEHDARNYAAGIQARAAIARHQGGQE